MNNQLKCMKCGELNYTEQAFGKCDLCYDCCEIRDTHIHDDKCYRDGCSVNKW